MAQGKNQKRKQRSRRPHPDPNQGRDLAARCQRLPLCRQVRPQKPRNPRRFFDPRPIFDHRPPEEVPAHHLEEASPSRTPAPCLPNLPIQVQSVQDTETSWTSSLGRLKKCACRLSLQDPRCGIWKGQLAFNRKSSWVPVHLSIRVGGPVLQELRETQINDLSPHCQQECGPPQSGDLTTSKFPAPDHKEALSRPDRTVEHRQFRHYWSLRHPSLSLARSCLPGPSHWAHYQPRPA